MNTPHIGHIRRLGLSRNISRGLHTPTSTPKTNITVLSEILVTPNDISTPKKTDENDSPPETPNQTTNPETVENLSTKSTKLKDPTQSTKSGDSKIMPVKCTKLKETKKNSRNSKKSTKSEKTTQFKESADPKQLLVKSTTLKETQPTKSGESKNLSTKWNETPTQTKNSRDSESLSIKSNNLPDTTQSTNSGNSVNLSIKSTNMKGTPVLSKQPIILNETPVSTKPTKYKLSLCKATTQALTRKRMISLKSESLIQPKRLKLELSTDELRSDDSMDKSVNCDAEPAELSVDREETEVDTSAPVLQKEIDELKKTIATIEKYEERSAELYGLIAKWQEAGQKTIEELKEKIEPKQDLKTILDHFSIDPELFNMKLSE